VAVDLFSGFGGLTQGIELAGFTTIMAANHNEYKVEVHEANHPDAEHWIADLVDPESSDYHSARDLPAGDLLAAGVSCVNHSRANTQKAYDRGLSLFDLEDPDYEARVTRSERDRATANCVLHYAERHHPLLILVECTTQLASWGPALPGRAKVGDGSTYRWWLKQFEMLGYRYRVLYLNSMFFGVGQSRDRGYWAFWDQRLPTPDLEHRPEGWCPQCDQIVESVWAWKTGVPPTGVVEYRKQYMYRCPRCRLEVAPAFTPSLVTLDLTNLGTRIGDREKPMADTTMARAERCRQRFGEFPAVLMPAKAVRGTERHPWQPMSTQTSQQETAILSTGTLVKAAGNTFERQGSDCRTRGLDEPLWTQSATAETGLLAPPTAIAVDNFQGAPRGVNEPLPTQCGSETLGLLSARVWPNRTDAMGSDVAQPVRGLVAGATAVEVAALSTGVVPFRKNTTPTTHAEAMPTVTSDQVPGLLTAAGRVQCNGSIDEAQYRAYPVDRPLGTVTATSINQGMLFSGWYKQNGSTGSETAPHPVTDPLGTLTGRDTTALLMAEWREALADLKLEDCYFRMMASHEIGRGCGFDVDFPDHNGTFQVWGSGRDQVDGFGNAVSPQVGAWIAERLRRSLHEAVAA
jgi:site-specific DNA-cytosine methylase